MRNRGLAPSLVAGINPARGDVVVAWMDADLSMPPESVQRLVDAIAETRAPKDHVILGSFPKSP